MIPKIVHYCWLSGDPYPDIIKKCLDSWHEKLPGYEFILWDKNRFSMENCIWVKQAYDKQKYAFAADYIRLYALYNYGGIYLDTDVEIMRSLNDLLDLPYFIGFDSQNMLEAAIIGAPKGTKWIYDCLTYYNDKTFIKANNELALTTLPCIMREQIEKTKKIQSLDNLKFNDENDCLFVFPFDFFCCKRHDNGRVLVTDRTYSVHHFAMSWLPRGFQRLSYIKQKMMLILGVSIVETIIKLFSLNDIKNKYIKR